MTFRELALIAGVTFGAALIAPMFLIPVLRRMGVLDKPNARSLHSTVRVRGAGLATLIGVIVGSAMTLATLESDVAVNIAVVVGAMILVSLVGAIEDWKGLSIVARAGLQFGIGVLLATGIVLLAGAPWWLIPIFGFTFAAYVNIANFMDGVNGISAMHGLIVGSLYAVLAWVIDLTWITALASVVALAFAAFLPWNLGRGRVFLGDAGSYLLGGSLAALSVALVASGASIVAVLAPLSVYLIDTGYTLVKRIAAGEKWYQSHRLHVFQRLTDNGLSHLQSTIVVSTVTVVVGAIGLLVTWQPNISPLVRILTLVLAGAILVVYVALPNLLKRRAIKGNTKGALP